MAFQEFTGIEYLMIDVANNFGPDLDKKDWDVRLAWFKDNEHHLESLIKKAEEPALYYAGVKTYRKAMLGEEVQYPISLDATASGMQIMACMTGDRKAAMICNVLDAGRRVDSYWEIYDSMLKALNGVATVKAKAVKNAVLTSLYGSQAVPRETFGADSVELEQFYATMAKEAPAVWELNNFYLDIWDPEAYSYEWVLPDNFHVVNKVMAPTSKEVTFMGKKYVVNYEVNQPTETGRSLGANSTHSVDGMIVREMTRRCDYDPIRVDALRMAVNGIKSDLVGDTTKADDNMVAILWDHYLKSGFLSARIMNHLSISNMHMVKVNVIRDLLDSLPKKPFCVLSVHDCFRCLPNYGNDLRRQYNNLLALIAKSELLSYILSQITGQTIKIEKYDPDMWKEIYDANYAIC